MNEKLQKVLAHAGYGSRREIEQLISAGRVSVDGKLATIGQRIDHDQVVVRIDGHTANISSQEESICRVLAYYKPEGEVSTRSDPEGRLTVFDRLPKIKGSRWVAVGRLDINTCGLLLFTTDGELANRLMHPSHQIEREYLVRVFGDVDQAMIKNLVNGVQLEDGLARFEHVVYSGGQGRNHTFYVVLAEGRHREVRRLWESQGVEVNRLKRVRYGDIYLDKSLPKGGWSELSLAQVNYLREKVQLPHENQTHVNTRESLSRQRIRTKKQKIRRAVKRHSTRVKGQRN